MAIDDADKELDAYNDGYTHEAQHTAYVLMETFDNFVGESRCAEQFPDVKKAADEAHEAMWRVYQLIGNKW